MKSYELQPTYENLLETYLQDSIDRNQDLYWFLSILNSLEDNCSIALEGKWGSGKTFFVKQAKMILDSLNEFIVPDSSENVESIKATFNDFKTQYKDDSDIQPQVSVYYDAWANDNDEDPMLSLIYEILQNVNSDYDFKEDISFLELTGSVIEFFTGKKMTAFLDALKREDPFLELKSSRDIHVLIEDFLESLLIERGNRLVIFIDELDRCKPSYAVKLLERIKHYFTNDRITFVFSINIDELQHTIKQYYGNGFNSSRYLDRFFDSRHSLPPANLKKFYQSIHLDDNTFDTILCRIAEYYHFEMREMTRYSQLAKIAVNKITHKNSINFNRLYNNTDQFCLFIVLPIIIGLKINDVTQYRKFIEGYDASPLMKVLVNCDEARDFWKLLLNENETYNAQEQGMNIVKLEDKLNDVYKALFVEKYQNNKPQINIGKLFFRKETYESLLRTSSLFSSNASFDIE